MSGDRTARERVERYRRRQREEVSREIRHLLALAGPDNLLPALELLGLAALIQLRDALRDVTEDTEREEVREG